MLIFIKNLFNNRPLVLIILYSSIFISLPIIYSKFSLFFLVISLLIIIKYSFNEATETKEIRTFQYILFAYSFWIVISCLIHYSALSALEPLTYITIDKKNVAWGLLTLKDITLIYLFFPVFYLLGFYLFKSSREGYRFLYFLTIFIIPSLIIAIYQGLFDIEFLNNPYFAKRNRVSGLNVDANGFGLSLFLLFPLCIFAILQIHGLWKKLFFGLLTVILLWCLFLSGSRTGFLGVIIFITILPWIWVWVNNKLPGKRRRFLILSPIVVILLIVTMGIMSAGKNFSPSLMLMKRFNSSYLAFKKGGFEEVLKISTRSVLWLQAYRLTELSPLSGWGPGGFYRNLYNIRFLHGEKRWAFDNANNHYLQISSEMGLLGAFFNILLHFFPLWMVFRIRKRVQNRDERWAIGISFVTVGIMTLLFVTGPHTMNLGVQWIFVVFLSYLFSTALKYGYSFSKFNVKFLLSIFILLTFIFLWGTYMNAFGKDSYKARQYADWWLFKYEKNCYTPEKSKDGWIRWCKKNAALQIPIRTKPLPAKIKLTLVANNPDIQLKPITVKYGGKEGVAHEVVLREQSWKTIEIPVTRDYIFEMTTPNKSLKRYFVLSLDVSRTWIPKEWGISDDNRELGIAVFISGHTPFL